MDSPRGRILLMRIGHEEGETISPEMVTHFDRCLGCMACVTACPSGVQYDKLIERTRPQLERSEARSWQERAYRRRSSRCSRTPADCGRSSRVADRAQARAAGADGAAEVDPLARAAGGRARRPLPKVKRSPAPVQRGTVAFMQGCIQRVFFGDVNAATIRVLSAPRAGRSTPPLAALLRRAAAALGRRGRGAGLAKATIAAYEGFDKVVTNVAGCGSAMKDYGHLLPTTPMGGAGEGLLRQVRRRPRAAGDRGAAGRPQADPAAHRLPRRLPPRARPGRPHPAARAAARDPRARAARARRVGAVLRLGRDLQPAPARGRGQARRAQGGEPARDRRGRDRRRQPGLRAADRAPSRPPHLSPDDPARHVPQRSPALSKVQAA